MKRKRCLRAVLAVCSAVLLTLGMLPSAALQTQAGNSNKLQQGVYTFILNESDHTAELRAIDDSASGTLDLPSEVTDSNGTAYKVTAINMWGTSSHSQVTKVNIPSSVTEIHSRFRFSGVTELTIPGSVKIFDAELQNSKQLQTLTFEEGVEKIGANSMFSGCKSLTTINLPSSLKEITAAYTFAYLEHVTSLTLPEGLTATADHAYGMFTKSTGLQEITLPASLTEDIGIPGMMFSGCSNLKKVVCEGDVTQVGNYAFRNCSSLTSFETSNHQLNSVGESAFYKCSSLTEIPSLSQLPSAGAYAFYNCSKLTGELDLSFLDQIPTAAFQSTGFTSVKFSDTLTSIGANAFCQAHLKSVDIPDSVTKIGSYAFFNAGLTSVTIGDGVKNLSDHEFNACYNLKTVEIGSGIETIADNAFASIYNGQDYGHVESVIIHTSKDDVVVNKVSNVPKDQIQFTESDTNSGDTIAVNGSSLQEAVNQAENGAVILLKKDVKLKEKVTIPADKNLTIRSDPESGQTYTIRGSEMNAPLIFVEKGASLKLQDLTVNGRGTSLKTGNTGLIHDEGTLTLEEGAVVKNAKPNASYASAVYVDGKEASLAIKGGSICDNTAGSSNIYGSAPVVARNGASIVMSGGEINNNNWSDTQDASKLFSSGGVMIDGGASMQMTGGTISNNSAFRGSAVTVFNGTFTMGSKAGSDENPVISQNKTTPSKLTIRSGNGTMKFGGGGTVFVDSNGKFILNSGTIEKNESALQGGGIALTEGGVLQMYGGVIRNNHANSCGGGIYTNSNDTELHAGYIQDNTAGQHGGGIYIENGKTGEDMAHMYNVLVKDNHAESNGGGIWLCPTGRAKVYVSNGAAVFDNQADKAGDDFSTDSKTVEGSSVTISDRMLGGGSVSWYQDGGIYHSNGSAWDPVNSDIPRYDPENPIPFTDLTDISNSVVLKSVPSSDGAKQLAQKKAKLIITGNTAEHGGGIAANGGFQVGEDSDHTKIQVKKVWDETCVDPLPESVEVDLFADGYQIDTVTLSEENDWTVELTGLPDDIGTITAKEHDISGYDASYKITETTDGDTPVIQVQVTNTKEPENPPTPTTKTRDVSVTKVWDDNNSSTRPDSVTVQLYRNGTAYGDAVVLSEDNDWSYSWSDLEYDAEWTVDETNVPDGYQKEVTQNGDSWTITNQSTPSDEPDQPENHDSDEPDQPSSHESDNPEPKQHTTTTEKHVTRTVTTVSHAVTPVTRTAPKTGDVSWAGWLALAVAAAAGTGFVWTSYRLRREKK